MTSLLLLALAQAAPLPAAPPHAQWSSVPMVREIRETRVSVQDSAAIMQLAERRRECRSSVGPMPSPRQHPNERMRGLNLELLLLVAPDGRFLQIIAAPGPCDAIRNYARSIVNARYRGVVRPPEGPAPAWYRTRLGFSWGQ